jgi:hypothetical protein
MFSLPCATEAAAAASPAMLMVPELWPILWNAEEELFFY